jgi:cyclopropane fatty-acyl-phospholipid synthase-like methyltransferase
MKSSDVIDLYDSEYFLKSVDGHADFEKFDGSFESLFERYQKNIQLLDLQPAHVYLEIGCGRGEVCIYHSLNGGSAKGVDYSRDAIALAQSKAIELGAMATFCVSSFSELNMPDNTYDRILASEFIEHISLSEGADFLGRVYAMLKPEGKLLVYTMPNTLQRKYGYPLIRLYARLRGVILPEKQEDTISEHYLKYHLNEQNYFKLKKLAVAAGFKKFELCYDWSPTNQSTIFRRFAWSAINLTPLKHIFLAHLVLLAEK